TDKKFAGSDTFATSLILASAIRKISGVDLVICGKQAIDGDTAQVGPGIAAHLSIPQAVNVAEISPAGSGVKIVRIFEESSEEVLLSCPAVLVCEKAVNAPRVPSLHSARLSRQTHIGIWNCSDLEINENKIGLKGSPTRVVKTHPSDFQHRESIVFDNNDGRACSKIYYELLTRKLI
ncbi:MAG TPA: electron transfer flavoprotein subunit beta, partial [Spirochaetia bacterium]|nr:electron transfer flavoprotein subunit beta [Spirochaetia bacterium]